MSKIKLALVTGFSEECTPLVKQCILSAYLCLLRGKIDYELTVYAYEYNWLGFSALEQHHEDTNRDYCDHAPFSRTINLAQELSSLSNVRFVQPKASSIEHTRKCFLPDIKIYHDFATKYMDEFEYAMFCHNDVVFNDLIPIFDTMIGIFETSGPAFIGEPHVDCRETISLRIYPQFIFVNSNRFKNYNLSFVNDYEIFAPEIRSWSMAKDGGAQLLASCYQMHSETLKPWAMVYRCWYRHVRLDSDTGIESYRTHAPHTDMYRKLLEEADRYVDSHLYGVDSV